MGFSRAIAKHIVNFRIENCIKSTLQLNKILSPFLAKGFENKTLAKIYQALRIEVNSEIDALKELLCQLPRFRIFFNFNRPSFPSLY